MTKVCSKCKIEKNTSDFSVRKNRPCGFWPACKACHCLEVVKVYNNDPEKSRANQRRYRKNNLINVRARDNLYRKNHPAAGGLAKNLRARIWKALKNKNKIAPTIELLGCSIDELKSWLSGWFQPGMSWENYGLWHIDHRMPCASFDLADPEQQRRCFHYLNLQPLWAKDNLSKGAKIHTVK